MYKKEASHAKEGRKTGNFVRSIGNKTGAVYHSDHPRPMENLSTFPKRMFQIRIYPCFVYEISLSGEKKNIETILRNIKTKQKFWFSCTNFAHNLFLDFSDVSEISNLNTAILRF